MTTGTMTTRTLTTRTLHPCGVLLVAAVLATTGCGVAESSALSRDVSTPLAEAIDVDALARAHTRYVGDNSADALILDALHLEVVGARTFELVTDKQPLELKINFNTSAQGLTDTTAHSALRKRAVLAMACIDNVEKVSWKVPHLKQPTGSITRAEAKKLAGGTLACGTQELKSLVTTLDA